MIELSLGLAAVLFGTSLLAGAVDAIAGGGGLITVPLLISIGLPAPVALGTNKLQSSVGTFVATHNYFKNNLLSFHVIMKGLLCGFAGTTLGAFTAQFIDASLLEKTLPFLMLFILLYTFYNPTLGLLDGKQRMQESFFYIFFGFTLGFYDGFLGPGTASFWVIALIFFLGYNLAKATAYTKAFNFKSNIIATVWFMIGHDVDYKIGLIMACGQLFGAKLGSQLVIWNGAKLVRPFFLTIVSFSLIVMFYKSYIGLDKLIKLTEPLNLILIVLIFASFIFFHFWRKRKVTVKK